MSSSTAPSEVTLRTIADWQLSPSKCDFLVELPKLQRGFVWEPSKVMDLWDSILRGFPIGSMMVSAIDPEPTADPGEGEHFWLLDGQQRATSIAYGFYNPWEPEALDPTMWQSKSGKAMNSIPILWLDLEPTRRDWDVKMFFPYLVTQSHPWSYNIDGGVISVPSRRMACEAMQLRVDYFTVDLSNCFPWEAKLPLPMSILLEVATSEKNPPDFWKKLGERAESLPAAWKLKFGEQMKAEPPAGLDTLLKSLGSVPASRVHLNHLTVDRLDNDVTTGEDNSLLFVRLNSGGVVLGGEELIFSLFKSAFPLAKEAVENCAAGFMAPSKLFGLFVRLAAAKSDPERLSRPVSLRDFKREIRTTELPLYKALEKLVREEHDGGECKAARLMAEAKSILCGDQTPNTAFCLPDATATRTINESPDIFLALLYWLRNRGKVEIGKEEHRRLLGCFTALCWFLPGNARAKQETLREWVAVAGDDVANLMWSASCVRFLFTRKELPAPVFPSPQDLQELLLKGVLGVETYSYERLPDYASASLWEGYKFLPVHEDDTDETRKQRLGSNLMSLINELWKCHAMLLYAQREYIRARFKAFGQWELTLKDTNCPWDWDHIYPSAYNRKSPDPVYRDWHNAIGNLRALSLSENRQCQDEWPSLKLKGATLEHGVEIRSHSFIHEDLWRDEIETLEYRWNALRDSETAKAMCSIVLKRMVSIYKEWHEQLHIGPLMDEIRSSANDARDRETPTVPTTSPELITEPSDSPA